MTKALIHGILYDTEAEGVKVIAYTEQSRPGDLDYVHEALWRTPKGNFFVRGKGGPASGYAVHESSNSTSGGASIRPLTIEEAREFVSGLDADEIDLAAAPELIKETA